jgi:hypothetical protein
MFERRDVVLPKPLASACYVTLSKDANKLLKFAARECHLNFVHEGLSCQRFGARGPRSPVDEL